MNDAPQKKYCILGNCQANALASNLQVSREFKEGFEFKRVTPIHRISIKDHQDFVKNILPGVDLFVYQPISENFRDGGFGFQDALNSLSEKTTVVSYPSIQFYGYHSSARVLGANIPVSAREVTKEIFGISGAELFHFSQLMISYIQGIPVDEAVDIFHLGFAEDDEFVQRRTTDSLRKLKQSENRFSISAPLGDYIAENFRKRQLFWSPRHPSGELLAEISKVIFQRLGISLTEDEANRLPQRDPLKLPQYPLQDFVKKALGIEFEGLKSFRSKSATLGLEDMVSGYYAIYNRLGRKHLSKALDENFPTLDVWMKMRDAL